MTNVISCFLVYIEIWEAIHDFKMFSESEIAWEGWGMMLQRQKGCHRLNKQGND